MNRKKLFTGSSNNSLLFDSSDNDDVLLSSSDNETTSMVPKTASIKKQKDTSRSAMRVQEVPSGSMNENLNTAIKKRLVLRGRVYDSNEDQKIMQYVAEDETRYLDALYLRFWMRAEAEGVFGNRTSQSLFERYKKLSREAYKFPIDSKLATLIRNYSRMSAEGRKEFRQKMGMSKEEAGNTTRGSRFSYREDQAILKFVKEKNKVSNSKMSLTFWTIAEKHNICPGRSAHSMLIRYQKIKKKNEAIPTIPTVSLLESSDSDAEIKLTPKRRKLRVPSTSDDDTSLDESQRASIIKNHAGFLQSPDHFIPSTVEPREEICDKRRESNNNQSVEEIIPQSDENYCDRPVEIEDAIPAFRIKRTPLKESGTKNMEAFTKPYNRTCENRMNAAANLHLDAGYSCSSADRNQVKENLELEEQKTKKDSTEDLIKRNQESKKDNAAECKTRQTQQSESDEEVIEIGASIIKTTKTKAAQAEQFLTCDSRFEERMEAESESSEDYMSCVGDVENNLENLEDVEGHSPTEVSQTVQKPESSKKPINFPPLKNVEELSDMIVWCKQLKEERDVPNISPMEFRDIVSRVDNFFVKRKSDEENVGK